MAAKRKTRQQPRRTARKATRSNGTHTTTDAQPSDLGQVGAAGTTTGGGPGASLNGTGGGLDVVSEVLQMSSNAVRVDLEQLDAEAEAVATEAAADDAAARAPPTPDEIAAAVTVENAEAGYKILALAVVGQGYDLIAPAWHVTSAEKSDMSDAVVQALLLWFPDGLIPPKYAALLVIAGVGARIAIARRDPDTGQLAPRHAQPTTATAPAATAH